MVSIKSGYWPSTYWTTSFWDKNYWPGYRPPTPHIVGFEGRRLVWEPEYPEDFWLYVLTVLCS